MAVIIRDALNSEFDEVANLNVEAYREYARALTSDNWDRMQTNLSKVAEIAKPGRLIVAERDRSLVGAVVYHPPGASNPRLFQPEWASMRLLAVLPQYRSQGIGQQLSLECIDSRKREATPTSQARPSKDDRTAYERVNGICQENVRTTGL
ncbi:GNAT family N-acetyltransferase [Chamaesiphon polymorphus]|nr:GNAT family N-acetyltransferase [Chamaesiphon polymorphus]